ncbi:MAG: hypothetical protein CMI02_04955 [Oceanospirillaceae bacterium]|nr:hypothetical protein [Oceanospirillaceae bacterium]|tara:strand:+ start:279 stop:800 length:522 start_codon:yes stop_codon:yes gene_type:complete
MDYHDLLTDIPAPAPYQRKTLCTLNIDQGTVAIFAGHRRTAKLFEMIYNIAGALPPVNNIGAHESDDIFPDNWGGIKHAHAVFKGIKRPFKDEGLDGHVFVYVIKPRYYYKYEVNMVCPAKRMETPKAVVLAVYVKFSDPSYTDGTILSWDWVRADEEDLPKGHTERYEERLW